MVKNCLNSVYIMCKTTRKSLQNLCVKNPSLFKSWINYIFSHTFTLNGTGTYKATLTFTATGTDGSTDSFTDEIENKY